MSTLGFTVVLAALYAGAALGALRFAERICAGIEPFEDGPRPGRPPSALLVSGAAALGAALAWRGLAPLALALAALLTISLVACWYTDVRCGIVADWFTLAPLGAVLALAGARRDPSPLLAAGLAIVPFALAALFSHGRGMGWGDVKLVALGAAVLGVETSILTMAAACLVAAVVAVVRRRRTEPIAFAPYVASAMACALVLPAGR